MDGNLDVGRTEDLFEAMRERVRLLQQLVDLGLAYDDRHLHDGGLLMSLLGRKATVIDSLTDNQRQLRTYAVDDPEDRQWRSAERREECQQLVREAERLLQEILQREQAMLAVLTSQRDAVAAQLQQGRDSTLASHAYSTGECLDQSTFDLCDS